jgi:hypothetical protein
MDGTVGAMKEYTDPIAFAMVSARSRQLSGDLFKIAHGTMRAGSLTAPKRLFPLLSCRTENSIIDCPRPGRHP